MGMASEIIAEQNIKEIQKYFKGVYQQLYYMDLEDRIITKEDVRVALNNIENEILDIVAD